MKNLHGTGKKKSQPQDTRDSKKWESYVMWESKTWTSNVMQLHR